MLYRLKLQLWKLLLQLLAGRQLNAVLVLGNVVLSFAFVNVFVVFLIILHDFNSVIY